MYVHTLFHLLCVTKNSGMNLMGWWGRKEVLQLSLFHCWYGVDHFLWTMILSMFCHMLFFQYICIVMILIILVGITFSIFPCYRFFSSQFLTFFHLHFFFFFLLAHSLVIVFKNTAVIMEDYYYRHKNTTVHRWKRFTVNLSLPYGGEQHCS